MVYGVTFRMEEVERTFEFRIFEDHRINGLNPEESFYRYLDSVDVGPAEPLVKALMLLHAAQSADWPPLKPEEAEQA